MRYVWSTIIVAFLKRPPRGKEFRKEKRAKGVKKKRGSREETSGDPKSLSSKCRNFFTQRDLTLTGGCFLYWGGP